MGVNSTFHQRARQDQLIGLAIELIGQGGLPAASTSAIARRAGVSRGVVNYNVGGRDELMRHVITRVYDLGRAAVQPAVDAAPDARGAVRAFVIASLAFYDQHPVEMRALREVFTDAELLDRAGTAEHRAELDALAALVARGQEDGDLAGGPVSLIVATVRATLDWAAGALAAGEGRSAVEDAALSLLDRALLTVT